MVYNENKLYESKWEKMILLFCFEEFIIFYNVGDIIKDIFFI